MSLHRACCCDGGLQSWQWRVCNPQNNAGAGLVIRTPIVGPTPTIGQVYLLRWPNDSPTGLRWAEEFCAIFLGVDNDYPTEPAPTITPISGCADPRCFPPPQKYCVVKYEWCDGGKDIGYARCFGFTCPDQESFDLKAGHIYKVPLHQQHGCSAKEFRCVKVVWRKSLTWQDAIALGINLATLPVYPFSFVFGDYDSCEDCEFEPPPPPEPCLNCNSTVCPDAITAIVFPTVSWQNQQCNNIVNTCCRPQNPVPGFVWTPSGEPHCTIGTQGVPGPEGVDCGSCSGTGPRWLSFNLSCLPWPVDPGCVPSPQQVSNVWLITASYHSCKGDAAPIWIQASPSRCPKGLYTFRGFLTNPPGCCGVVTTSCKSNLASTVFEVL